MTTMSGRTIRDALDAKMNLSLVAYRKEIEQIRWKVWGGEGLTEAERGIVCRLLESAEEVFNSAHFWLAHRVEAQ